MMLGAALADVVQHTITRRGGQPREPVVGPLPHLALEAARKEAEAEALPLTYGETEGFRLAVQECWNLGSTSTAASRTSVVLGFNMTPEGIPQNIRLVRSDGESTLATDTAYETARRAIIRCTRGGYDLPAAKYPHWSYLEVRFEPSGLRVEEH